MPPIVRETEAPSATSATPAVRPASANPRPEDTAGRVQPVALEVPVTVNGARTVEGSDKREPFSESTKTVLVFGNGAVLRLSSSVAPGQLLFVTNEKTKKEVVCQVVKSKNYRNVSGYVELEFTEPMIGFWGMRFPNDRIGKAPSAPAPVPAVPAAVAPRVPAAPIVAKAAEPTPILAMPVAPPPVVAIPEPLEPLALASVAPPAPVAVAPAVEEFAVQAEPSAQVIAPAAVANIDIPVEPVPEKTPEPVVSALQENEPAIAESVKNVSPASSVLEFPSAFDAQPKTEALAEPAEIAATSLPHPSEGKSATPPAPQADHFVVTTQKEATPLTSDFSTEALKLETARLQEQLSSLLFTEKPAAKPVPSVPVPAVDQAAVSDAAAKLLELAKVTPAPAPVKENKPVKLTPAVIQSSLDLEEVKIPAWLEPLARNAAASSAAQESTVKEEAHHIDAMQEFAVHSEVAGPFAMTANASASEGPRFGSQLVLDEKNSSSEGTSSGSKKGLLIAAIAAGILVAAAGGTWYLRQSSNASSGMVAAPQTSGFASAPVQASNLAPSASNVSSAPVASSPAGNPEPGVVLRDAVKPAANTVALATAAHEAQPVPAQPKKPILGDVHLATPVVNRNGAAQEAGEVAPNLDAAQTAENGDALGSGLTAGDNKQPVAPVEPVPVGGDVVPAKMIASVPPVYSTLAKSQHVSGDVKIDALIDANGRVTTMKVISGPTLLHQAAMEALRQWKYRPATLNGNPVAMHLTVTLQFRLQ